MKTTSLDAFVRWLVSLAMPFFLASGTVLGIIAWEWPSYPEFEYGRIAPDRFGFSDEVRLTLAKATLAYLRHPDPADEVIYMLEELRLPGSDGPLYNEREIGHMVDVKVVTDAFRWAFRVLALIVVAGLVFLFARPERRSQGYKALLYGGLFTTGMLVAILVLILVAWNAVFTQFHNLFFDAGTWTFAYSDSLIRLFPEQFWFDFGMIWAGLILVEGLILVVIGRQLSLRR